LEEGTAKWGYRIFREKNGREWGGDILLRGSNPEENSIYASFGFLTILSVTAHCEQLSLDSTQEYPQKHLQEDTSWIFAALYPLMFGQEENGYNNYLHRLKSFNGYGIFKNNPCPNPIGEANFGFLCNQLEGLRGLPLAIGKTDSLV
jgi:hypothetical protein